MTDIGQLRADFKAVFANYRKTGELSEGEAMQQYREAAQSVQEHMHDENWLQAAAGMSFARQIDEQRYREQTERQAQMPGAMANSFRCHGCKQDRLIGSRKALVKDTTRYGFVCRECDAKRQARKAKEAA